ncbi:hypothetical protein DL771_008905 [Monosporascus sp. 5C6A]|nr:hypothetical protein DL771_008905 [Monosporascus sp. 5C6A]
MQQTPPATRAGGCLPVCTTWPPPPAFTEADVPAGSQSGRVFIVTGGNAGIGFELCKILFRSGGTIYMASRSKEKAEVAIKLIEGSIPESTQGRGQLKFLHLDLNNLDSVREAVQNFSQQESKLDILWNNAGAGAYLVKYGQRTAQGFEPFMGMHCIATLLFSKLLLPQLKAAAAAAAAAAIDHGKGTPRVLWLGSGLIDSSAPVNGIDFDLLERGIENRVANYAASKAGCWILGREFARRLLHEPIFGAYTELYAGLSPDITMEHNGAYVIPWGRLRQDKAHKRQDIIKAMKSEEEGGLGFGKKFWEWCETQGERHQDGN